MLDTWAKIDSGYLVAFGSKFNFGHFDDCLKFRQEISKSDIIQGQHCLVTFGASEISTLPDEFESNFDWREM